MNNNSQTVSATVSFKKSTIKSVIVIAAAVILGGIAAWYIRASAFLPFSIWEGGAFDYISSFALAIIASVVLTLAVPTILFRFIKPKFRFFVFASAAVSLLIGASFGYELLRCMSDSYFWIFGNTTDFTTVVLLDILYHFIYAAIIFGISLLFYKPIKKLAK